MHAHEQPVRATPTYLSNFGPVSPEMRVSYPYSSSYFSAYSNRASKTFLLYIILSYALLIGLTRQLCKKRRRRMRSSGFRREK
jgi:hypothetical protein